MLTYESLIEQAELREMPKTKLRGILREYLQILILKQMYNTNHGKKLYFTGGTYLRLVHNLKRFSEDLDFDTDKLTKKDFESLLRKLSTELKRTGLDSNLSFNYWGNVYSSKIAFPNIEKKYDIKSTYSKAQGIIIKIEAKKSKNKIKKETDIISGFGELFPIVCTDKGIAFANKIDAMLKKERGRHIYDLMFMLTNNFPIDKKTLLHLKIKNDIFNIILKRIKSFSKAELKKQALGLRPFLFDEVDADLVANAQELLPRLIEKKS